jgi:NitT/TauT family transport system substrate-binding protein
MRLNPAGTTPRGGASKPPRARFCVALASGLAVVAAAGCASSAAAGGGSVSATITIAAVPGINDVPLYMAQQAGLFTKAGLHVVIKKESQESAVFAALRGNQAQIASADYGDLFYQQSRANLAKAPAGGYKILADGYDATTGSLEVLALPASNTKNKHPITSPEQLPGATVGIPSDDVLPTRKPSPIAPGSGIPDSLEVAAATSALSDFVADPNSVDWVAESPSAEVSDLIAGRVQAILVGQPYIVAAELRGAVEVMDACSGATANLPLSGYVATSAWAKANPMAVADFQSAIAQAQSAAAMDGLVQKMLPATGMTTQEADLATIGTYPTSTSTRELERVSRLLWAEDMYDSPAGEPLPIPLITTR